jgi:hypothetical protein
MRVRLTHLRARSHQDVFSRQRRLSNNSTCPSTGQPLNIYGRITIAPTGDTIDGSAVDKIFLGEPLFPLVVPP